MKTFFALSLLVSSVSFAAPVAQIRTAIGFAPVPSTITISLDADGTVTRETVSRPWNASAPTTETVLVANLNPAIIEVLLKDIEEASSLQIVAENPTAPECMDAPTTSYSVLKNDALVLISKNQGCKNYFLADYQGRNAYRILNSLKTLAGSL